MGVGGSSYVLEEGFGNTWGLALQGPMHLLRSFPNPKAVLILRCLRGRFCPRPMPQSFLERNTCGSNCCLGALSMSFKVNLTVKPCSVSLTNDLAGLPAELEKNRALAHTCMHWLGNALLENQNVSRQGWPTLHNRYPINNDIVSSRGFIL